MSSLLHHTAEVTATVWVLFVAMLGSMCKLKCVGLTAREEEQKVATGCLIQEQGLALA